MIYTNRTCRRTCERDYLKYLLQQQSYFASINFRYKGRTKEIFYYNIYISG